MRFRASSVQFPWSEGPGKGRGGGGDTATKTIRCASEDQTQLLLRNRAAERLATASKPCLYRTLLASWRPSALLAADVFFVVLVLCSLSVEQDIKKKLYWYCERQPTIQQLVVL